MLDLGGRGGTAGGESVRAPVGRHIGLPAGTCEGSQWAAEDLSGRWSEELGSFKARPHKPSGPIHLHLRGSVTINLWSFRILYHRS